MEQNHKIQLLARRDLFWIIFILVGVIVALLTVRVGSDKNVVNQVSFAIGISSIFLALVAIVYAYFQSQESSRQNGVVQQTLMEINTTVANHASKLDEIRRGIEDQSLGIASSMDDVKRLALQVKESDSPAEQKQNAEGLLHVVDTLQSQIDQMNQEVHVISASQVRTRSLRLLVVAESKDSNRRPDERELMSAIVEANPNVAAGYSARFQESHDNRHSYVVNVTTTGQAIRLIEFTQNIVRISKPDFSIVQCTRML